jgi:anthranilate/para-aminobenzoate synthase component II
MSGALVRRQPGRCPHGRVQAIEARESSRLLGTKILGSFVLFNSLAVDARTRLPENPWVILSTGEGSVMASEHRLLPRLSVQFHPESFASRDGEALLDLVSTRLFAV